MDDFNNETFEKIVWYSSMIIMGMTTFVFPFVIYTVFTKSTKYMRFYKIYLIFEFFWSFFFGNLLSMSYFSTYLPYFIIKINGKALLFNKVKLEVFRTIESPMFWKLLQFNFGVKHFLCDRTCSRDNLHSDL